jgi:hypothetical protein
MHSPTAQTVDFCVTHRSARTTSHAPNDVTIVINCSLRESYPHEDVACGDVPKSDPVDDIALGSAALSLTESTTYGSAQPDYALCVKIASSRNALCRLRYCDRRNASLQDAIRGHSASGAGIFAPMSTRLRIWGSGVRISSGAPIRSPFSRRSFTARLQSSLQPPDRGLFPMPRGVIILDMTTYSI